MTKMDMPFIDIYSFEVVEYKGRSIKGGIHLTEELINEILESIGLEKIEYANE